MLSRSQLESIMKVGRSISLAKAGDHELGLLKQLPGLWTNLPSLPGRGWNMIALPFASDDTKAPINYRLLVNQYNEELRFSEVDKAVPNRGIKKVDGKATNKDQFVATMSYEQTIKQVAATDFPLSGLAGAAELPIHHEPGLFLYMANEATDGLEYARLGTIPHGNSILALGKGKTHDGAPEIPDENGLPIGVSHDLEGEYLEPYKHFQDNPFQGVFDPVDPNALLKEANEGVDIVKTTEFVFDTKLESGGISNIPFIEKQADATEMTSRFWIQELAEKDAAGNPKLRLQYTQTVFLDFFKNPDGELIRWPHVSINTLEKA